MVLYWWSRSLLVILLVEMWRRVGFSELVVSAIVSVMRLGSVSALAKK